MYKKGTGNDKQRKDERNRMLCPYRKFSQAVIGMYESVKSCISVNGKLSPLFECNTGVRQGENLSPIYTFCSFLNDLESV